MNKKMIGFGVAGAIIIAGGAVMMTAGANEPDQVITENLSEKSESVAEVESVSAENEDLEGMKLEREAEEEVNEEKKAEVEEIVAELEEQGYVELVIPAVKEEEPVAPVVETVVVVCSRGNTRGRSTTISRGSTTRSSGTKRRSSTK